MEIEKCPECNGKLQNKIIEYKLLGQRLGNFEALVCDKCGEQIFDEKASDKIEKKAKELGLWGLYAKVKVNQVGNSIAVTVTKPISEFLNLKKGKNVLIYPEDKHTLKVEIIE